MTELNQSKPAMIIGTIFVDNPSRPTIISELNNEKRAVGSENILVYCEDESGRILLSFSKLDRIPIMMTGIVLSIRGKEVGGVFEVHDTNYTQKVISEEHNLIKDARNFYLISDLDFNTNDASLVIQYIAKNSCVQNDILILAGNCIGKGTKYVEPSKVTNFKY